MFLKKAVIFFGVYDVCRKSPVYHTPLFVVNLQHIFAVYEMQAVSGNPLYIRARINIKVGGFVDRNRCLENLLYGIF